MNRQLTKITALYCRVDGGKHRPETINTLQNQQEALIQYAKEQGLQNVHIFSDCGYSGADLNRPELQHMLREIKSGNVTALVVKSLNRLTRNYLDGMVLLEEMLSRYGVAFYSLDGLCLPLFSCYSVIVTEGGRAQ